MWQVSALGVCTKEAGAEGGAGGPASWPGQLRGLSDLRGTGQPTQGILKCKQAELPWGWTLALLSLGRPSGGPPALHKKEGGFLLVVYMFAFQIA